jgi:hypothetical protein
VRLTELADQQRFPPHVVGALTGGLIARWGQDRTFVELARRVARYLDPKYKSQKVYQRIADALGGRGMVRMM